MSVLGSLFGGGSSHVAKATEVSAAPSAVTTTSGTDALDAAKASKKISAAASGYQSTILTGSTGDTSLATTSKKTLLGG